MNSPQHWRLKEQRYRMTPGECVGCEILVFPPKDYCPGCASISMINEIAEGRGVPVDLVIDTPVSVSE